jgi:hypothetical protein
MKTRGALRARAGPVGFLRRVLHTQYDDTTEFGRPRVIQLGSFSESLDARRWDRERWASAREGGCDGRDAPGLPGATVPGVHVSFLSHEEEVTRWRIILMLQA